MKSEKFDEEAELRIQEINKNFERIKEKEKAATKIQAQFRDNVKRKKFKETKKSLGEKGLKDVLSVANEKRAFTKFF